MKQHCDEEMGEHAVQDFVTGVYRAVEGKTRAFHTMARPSHGEPWVELYVGRTIVSCRAILYDDLGELAEYNPSAFILHHDGEREHPYALQADITLSLYIMIIPAIFATK